MVSLVTAVLGSASESKDHMPLLRWILINALAAFAFLVLWHFGLVQVMFETDRTHISNLILALFVLTVAHCFYQTILVSKDLVVPATCKRKSPAPDAASSLLATGF